ncbi:Gfo/Idh/MocA family oxidoreductase [Sphingomonas sp. R-74633]|nr:Gfo/Idh/MocA family oxidoreductase [Sphingomonas sp. R-74633]
MAVDYWNVLTAMSVPITVVGRSEASAARFQEKTGAECVAGGIENYLATAPVLPEVAIVAVTVEQLAPVARALIDAGVLRLLVEKPGALNEAALTQLAETARARGAQVYIAYNRRFYASVIEARRIIAEEGGVRSLTFEFNEWSHIIERIPKAPGVKENWLVGNSTHVIDLAFHLAGSPTELYALTSGGLAWHPSASTFVGAGRTESGALFSYHANWAAPGRWGVEVLLPSKRLIFRPLEGLQYISLGKVAPVEIELDDALDKQFKPGLYRQVEVMLDGDVGLCTLDEQLANWPIYKRIANYGSDQ